MGALLAVHASHLASSSMGILFWNCLVGFCSFKPPLPPAPLTLLHLHPLPNPPSSNSQGFSSPIRHLTSSTYRLEDYFDLQATAWADCNIFSFTQISKRYLESVTTRAWIVVESCGLVVGHILDFDLIVERHGALPTALRLVDDRWWRGDKSRRRRKLKFAIFEGRGGIPHSLQEFRSPTCFTMPDTP